MRLPGLTPFGVSEPGGEIFVGIIKEGAREGAAAAEVGEIGGVDQVSAILEGGGPGIAHDRRVGTGDGMAGDAALGVEDEGAFGG